MTHSVNWHAMEHRLFLALHRGPMHFRMNALNVNADGRNTNQMVDNSRLNFELVVQQVNHYGFKFPRNQSSLTEFSLDTSAPQLIARHLCRNVNSRTN